MSETDSAISRKPVDTRFHQQKLSAWNPEFSMSSLYPFMLVVSILFLAAGIGLVCVSNAINEFRYDYTECKNSNGSGTCNADIGMNGSASSCSCQVRFNLTTTMIAPVYLYYQLNNFHQNHRMFVSSRDDKQLRGLPVTADSLSRNCDPFRLENVNGTNLPIAPCGIAANSIFNDTFQLSSAATNGSGGSKQEKSVPMTSNGIAWRTDYSLLFGKPASFNNTAKPVNWPQPAYKRNAEAYRDEELIVWMRISALNNIRKLHRIILHEKEFKNGLPAGEYVMYINYAYPVAIFGGRKFFFLSNTSGMGGKNAFMGIIYIIVGIIQLILAITFIIIPYAKRTTRSSQPNDMKLILMK